VGENFFTIILITIVRTWKAHQQSTQRAPSSSSDSPFLIQGYNTVDVLGTFTHTTPEDEMLQQLSVALQRGNAVAFLQHFWLRLDAVAVIPCLVQCLKPTPLCKWAAKIIVTYCAHFTSPLAFYFHGHLFS